MYKIRRFLVSLAALTVCIESMPSALAANDEIKLTFLGTGAPGLGLTDYGGEMMVANDLMTLTIGDKITVGRAEGAGTDIFTEADVVEK